ncbi:MAG TPA: transketolase [Desulfobacterales bacterium]|nr:transketolase [Desulfobacterales bacterium]
MTPIGEGERRELERAAVRVRRAILRMLKAGRSGHLGGALSCADILTALYFNVMRVDPRRPDWRERDRFVLSAGHKCLALYAVLSERGFLDECVLDTYGANCTRLGGHPDMHKVPGIETNTGALGHGLAIAGGMAMGLKLDAIDARVYVVTGDGELAEGSNWEAAAAASHHRLDNLVVFVDRNRLQICGPTADVMNCEPLDRRWEAFGWEVRVIDGHDMGQIVACAAGAPFVAGRPSVVIADTVKGKGLSFAENRAEFHYWKATEEGLAIAERELLQAEERIK